MKRSSTPPVILTVGNADVTVQRTRMLRHRKDRIFDSACMMLDQETRRCTVYEARPGVCRKYPDSSRCGYYDFLKFEREHQADDDFIPSA